MASDEFSPDSQFYVVMYLQMNPPPFTHTYAHTPIHSTPISVQFPDSSQTVDVSNTLVLSAVVTSVYPSAHSYSTLWPASDSGISELPFKVRRPNGGGARIGQ